MGCHHVICQKVRGVSLGKMTIETPRQGVGVRRHGDVTHMVQQLAELIAQVVIIPRWLVGSHPESRL